jgi:hypothetical protein
MQFSAQKVIDNSGSLGTKSLTVSSGAESEFD